MRLDWSVQPPGDKPELTSADTASAALGQALQLQLAATGNPAFFEAEDLPPGLICSPGGLISGTPQTAGTFTVRLLALNAQRHAEEVRLGTARGMKAAKPGRKMNTLSSQREKGDDELI